jgi:deoxyadenosine/deoxycytidine kinase
LSPSKTFALASNQAKNTKFHDYDDTMTHGNECGLVDEINTPVNLKLITEPVNLWRNLEGNNLLELMYTDPHRWAFAFHSYVQLTMLEKHLELNQMESIRDLENMNSNENLSKCNISIMERSLYSAKYCFVENIFKS